MTSLSQPLVLECSCKDKTGVRCFSFVAVAVLFSNKRMGAVTGHSIKLAAFILMIDTAVRISISKCWQEDTPGKLEKGPVATRIASLPMGYVITPTYARATQMADLTRLSQALQGVPNVTWILVEDSGRKTQKVERLLNKTNVNSGDSFIFFKSHRTTNGSCNTK